MQQTVLPLKLLAYFLTLAPLFFCFNSSIFANTESEAARIASIIKPTSDFSKAEAF